MKPSFLTIHSYVIEQMKEYCLNQYPHQGYGFLAGHGSVITHFFPIPGQNSGPCFLDFEPRAYFEAVKKIRSLQLEWLGVLHSHPLSDAYPSARDRSGWHFVHKSFWILSLKDKQVQLGAYYIKKNQAIPIIYKITD
ncbi:MULTISPECIES: Mov34/MPN/PAD-1 family protein [Thermoactinomyces]|jgi:proteasome lid subunit RPN8/RPN11|uniref:M67 family metallopeptidase n=1 Tax=Thermoactinomyces daqus TaxID=1329516 RepID=A0A7W1X8Q7_9BACL|nr:MULTISPECIES: M67 family metallopeptidase [Thermoactinomyces]MBA4542170.1 M67 family metallopeptidase [Thermoactinomyces daqus]MBH8599014.1 M67 family metallopeptidase [Thermoactinomyces sp. CICC 10523]MBH8608441.1 M67 family metallopeptidase [Thermoactinomyces sp. CICC 10521]